MNKTKTYTIAFVVGCFCLILMLGIYQGFIPNQDIQQEKVVENKKEEPSSKNEELKEETKPSQTNKEEKETTKSETTQKEPEKKEETKPTQPEVKPEVSSNMHIQFVIQGIETTIANEKVEVEKGKSVYDVLKSYTTNKGIELKTSGPKAMIYIKGIQGLDEFDHGPTSGWKYKVNGVFPSKSAGSYIVEDGDQVEWIYTTE